MERSALSIEVELIVEAIYLRYGYDFRDYSRASIKRRLELRLAKEKLNNLAQLQHRIIHEPAFFKKIAADFSINVTEMFRDPEFYAAMQAKIFPDLSAKKDLKVWIAGCGTGEEAYSLAILFKEHDLYERTQFYATDLNHDSLAQAKRGEVALKKMRQFSGNYHEAGGRKSLTDYFSLTAQHALFEPGLLNRILFSDHNLVHDQVFGEMDLVLCRNVLIYFNKSLQQRVLRLFKQSLKERGYLCLGMKEGLYFNESGHGFETVDSKVKIYRLKEA